MTDLLLDSDLDLDVVAGGFTTGDATKQNIELLAITSPGQWKFRPTAGMALVDLLNDETNFTRVRHHINTQLRADGAKLKKLEYENTNLIIDASYEN